MITFRHESFIKEAIEGVLMQEGEFDLELIIADDCSPDSTSEVVRQFLDNHPRREWIKYKKHEHNIGMMPNFIYSLKAAKGDYIALCEGDDYWTDTFKLQKQLDFLEKHEDFVLSFHNVFKLNDSTGESVLFREYKDDTYSGVDMFDSWLIPTASVLFRNVLPAEFPPYFEKATHGDFALFMMLSQHGKLGYLDEAMAIYRISDVGVTQTGFKGIHHNLAHVAQLEHMRDDMGRHVSKFNQRISNYLVSTGYLYALEGRKKDARDCIRKAFSLNKKEVVKSFKYICLILLYSLKIR